MPAVTVESFHTRGFFAFTRFNPCSAPPGTKQERTISMKPTTLFCATLIWSCFVAAATAQVEVSSTTEYRVFKICESDVQFVSSDNVTIGGIDSIVVAPEGRIVSFVLAPSASLAVRDQLIVVPFAAVRIGHERQFHINVEKELVLRAPMVARAEVRTIVHRDFMERVNTHFHGSGERRGEPGRGSQAERRDREPSSTLPGREGEKRGRDSTTSQAERREPGATSSQTQPPATQKQRGKDADQPPSPRKNTPSEADRDREKSKEPGKDTGAQPGKPKEPESSARPSSEKKSSSPDREKPKAETPKGEKEPGRPTPSAEEQRREKGTGEKPKAEKETERPASTTEERRAKGTDEKPKPGATSRDSRTKPGAEPEDPEKRRKPPGQTE